MQLKESVVQLFGSHLDLSWKAADLYHAADHRCIKPKDDNILSLAQQELKPSENDFLLSCFEAKYDLAITDLSPYGSVGFNYCILGNIRCTFLA